MSNVILFSSEHASNTNESASYFFIKVWFAILLIKYFFIVIPETLALKKGILKIKTIRNERLGHQPVNKYRGFLMPRYALDILIN